MEMDDEPDPEKKSTEKAKDELNIFSDSEDEDEEDDKQLNDAGDVFLLPELNVFIN